MTDILSSTTPGDWYHDGLLKEEYKALAFVSVNTENLLQDMAMGRGEYVSSMGELLGVPVAREEEFFALAQRRSRDVMFVERHRAEEILLVLRHDWSNVADGGSQVRFENILGRL